MALVAKNLLASAGDMRGAGSVPGWKDPLEEGMAAYRSVLAQRIPRTEELCGLRP